MAAIVKPTLKFMLDWSCAPELRVSAEFRVAIRDFSFTGRVGELAQGVSYAYWNWERGYTWITDFGPWAAQQAGFPVGIKSPDYAMFNPTTGDLAIMEAKGTSSHCHKSQMKKALAQCNAALPHVLATRGFGSVLTLDAKSAAGQGFLHIRDPEKVNSPSLENIYSLFRRSYASWFDLVGDDDQAAFCRGLTQTAERPSPAYARVESVNRKATSPLGAIVATAMGFDPARTSFKIDQEVAEALNDFEVFKSTDWKEYSERVRSEFESQRNMISFPDGTSIVER